MRPGIHTPGGPPRQGSVWRNRAFLRLWAALSISEAGSELTLLALPLTAILLLHASPFAVGLLTTAGFLPYLLFGLPAGVVVDRSRPLPWLIGGDLGRAALLASIPLAALAGRLTLVHLYVVAFAAGSLTVIFGVAHQTTIHRIVDRADLLDANSKVELSLAGAQVTGPGVGGLIIGALSAPVAIALDAASFVISAFLMLGMRVPAREDEAGAAATGGESFLGQISEGLRYITGHPVLRAVAMSLALTNFFGGVFDAIQVLFFVRVLHLAAATIGLVFATAGVGSVIGAALATRLGRRLGIGRVILLGAIPAGWILIPLAPSTAFPIPVLMLANFLSSVLIIAYNVTQRGLRQAITPARMQGRMTATMRFLIVAPVPLGALIGGILGSSIGLRPTLFVGAFGGLLTAVPIVLSPIPGIREIPEQS